MIRECLLCRLGDRTDTVEQPEIDSARCTCSEDCFSWLCKAAGKIQREPLPRERYV